MEQITKVKEKIITGQDIERIQTIGSMYNNDCVVVIALHKSYYMKVSEILKFDTDFNGVKFKVVKKKVREYLEVLQE